MHAAGADGFAQAVIRVVLVVRKDLHPAPDQRGRHGLRADVHQPPLIEPVIRRFYVAALNRIQYILRPRHQQPDDCAALVRDGAQNPFGLRALEQHRPAARNQTAEPVHLRAGVIERRYAEEHVVLRLAVMRLLAARRMNQRAMGVQYRLGEAGRAGGIVDRRVVVGDGDIRRVGRAQADHVVVIVCECRAVLAHIEQMLYPGNEIADILHAAGEFRPEGQHCAVGLFKAVSDLLRRIAVVERHGHSARLQNAEVDRQPFERIHQQNRDFIALFAAAREQQIGEAIGLFVKLAPCHLAAERLARLGLHQRILAPCDAAFALELRIDLHQSRIVGKKRRVADQELGNRHGISLLYFCRRLAKRPLQSCAEDDK